MNYQETLDYFKRRKNMYLDDKVQEYENKAIKALERQIPRKPIITNVEYEEVEVCPHCQSRQPILDGSHYCAECGQRIDWTI